MTTNPKPILKMIITANDQIFSKIFSGSASETEIAKLQEYIETADRLDAPAVAAWVLLTVGVYYDLHGKQGLAIAQYEESYNRASSVDDFKHMAAARSNMGVLYRYRGEYTTALAYYEDAGQIIEYAANFPESDATSLTNDAVRTQVYASLGQTYLALGRIEDAEQSFHEVINGFKEASRGSIDAIIQARQGLAEVYLQQGNTEDAWSSINLAKREAESLKDNFFLSIIYLTMAHIARRDMSHETSPEVYYQNGRAALTLLGQSALVGQLLLEEARYQRRLGNVQSANRFANEAQTMFAMLQFDEFVSLASRLNPIT
jgi:tetratricopeptide (TPR) repeat protein